jgi:hypothetical protein
MGPIDVHHTLEAVTQGLGQLIQRQVVGTHDLESRCRHDGLEVGEGEPRGLARLEHGVQDRQHVRGCVTDLIDHDARTLAHGGDEDAVLPDELVALGHPEASQLRGGRLGRERDDEDLALVCTGTAADEGLPRAGGAPEKDSVSAVACEDAFDEEPVVGSEVRGLLLLLLFGSG